MKTSKFLSTFFMIFSLIITSCDKNDDSFQSQGTEEEAADTPATLAQKFKGSYACTIKASKPKAGTVYPQDKLIIFLTPVDDKTPDKLYIEVRMWSSSIMFHDLTIKVPVNLIEQSDKSVMGKIDGNTIDYVVMGMDGKEKGDATLKLTHDQKGIPQLESVVLLDGAYDYRLEFSGTRRSSKLLPGAVSTI